MSKRIAFGFALISLLLLSMFFAFIVQPAWAESAGSESLPVSDWVQYHGSAAHDGVSSSAGPMLGVVAWSKNLLARVENSRFPNDGRFVYPETRVNPGLIVAGGRLIVSVSDLQYKYIYGLNPANSKVAYTGYTARTIMDDPTSLGSFYPVSDGTKMYFGDYCIGCSLQEGPWLVGDNVADGSNVWVNLQNAMTSESPEGGFDLLMVNGGILYSVLYNSNTLQAFDAATGTSMWNRTFAGSINTIPTAGLGTVLIGYSDKPMVTAVDASTGQTVWNFTVDSPVACTPACCVLGNFFFGTTSGKFYAVTPNGTELWSKNLDGSVAATPSIASGKAFVATRDGKVHAFYALNGTDIWRFESGDAFTSQPVVSGNGLLYQGSTNGVVFALNVTVGNEVWEFNVGSNITTSPAIYNGSLFVATSEGLLFSFNDAGPPPQQTEPQANFNWSPFRPNAGDTVTFDASSSSTGWNGTQPVPIVSYSWNFGDNATAMGKTVNHIFDAPGIYKVRLNVTNNKGQYSICENNVTIGTAVLSFSLSTSTSLIGFKVNLDGNLTFAGKPVDAATVLMYYSINKGSSWNDITAADTNADGHFSAIWMPAATGNYLVKAEWLGNATIPEAKTIANLAVIASTQENVFSLASNSTISNLAYNSTTNTLSFAVSGPSNTTGITDVFISKTILSEPTDLTVSMDGKQLNYSAESIGGSWKLHFAYSHSTHTIIMELPEPSTTSSSSTASSADLLQTVATVLAVVVVAVVIAVTLIVVRRKRRTANGT